MSTGAKIGLFGCLVPILILVLIAGCVAVVGGGDSDSGDDTTETSDTDTEEAADEEGGEEEGGAEEEEETSTTISDGVHRVGDDIEPGTYSTEGPDPDDLLPMCYYARLSGLGGELEEVIANNNIEGPGTVEVSESDVALELSGGCEWELLD